MMGTIQSYAPFFNFLFNEVFGSLVFVYLIAGAVSILRIDVDRKWVLISGLIIFYLVCIGLAIILGLVSRSMDSLNHSALFPKELIQLKQDWGKDLSVEKRNKYSLVMARSAYVNGGYFRDYYDLDGNLQSFVPNEEDRKNRASFISSFDQMEQNVTLYFWAGIGWLLIPLLGTGIGFTNLGRRIGSTLAKKYFQAKAVSK
jgi:hypothetical protein